MATQPGRRVVMCEKDKGKAATWVGNGMNITQANRPFWISMAHAEPLFKLQRERSQRQDWRERQKPGTHAGTLEPRFIHCITSSFKAAEHVGKSSPVHGQV